MKLKLFQRAGVGALFAFLLTTLGATLALADHDGDGIPMLVTGDLTVEQVDDFANHSSQVRYLLQDSANGKTFYLRFDKMPERLATGMKLTVHGIGRGNEIAVPANGHTVQQAPVVEGLVSGTQNALVILLNFTNANIECSQSYVQNLMFSGSASVNTVYQETSYGNVSFAGLVAGPYTINYSTNGACDYNGWAAAGEAAATAAGINVSQYPRRVYVFPNLNNPCGWAGLGTIGGNPSKSWIAYCNLIDVYMHELGHNVNMHHSSTPGCEYCDVSDFMGYGGVGIRQVNAPHKEQMGWLPASKVVLATGNTTVNVAPLELYPSQTALPQALKIAKPDTGEYYYFSFRRKLGFDSSLGTDYADKANIHRYAGSGAIQTFFLGGLQTGQSFSDTVNGFTVTQLATTTDYSTLQVSFGCATLAPTVSMSPASQSALAGTTLNYSVQVVNRDNSTCGSSTFILTPTVPGGWLVPAPNTLTLPPGGSGSLTFAVTSPVGTAGGNYAVVVGVTDASATIHNGSASATYVVNVCTPVAPTVTMSPSSQSANAGTTLNYSVQVLNRDNSTCGSSTFTLTPTVPLGWPIPPSQSLTLAPGGSGTKTFAITSPAGATATTYTVSVGVSDTATATHNGSASATYVVKASDNTPPSNPSNLKATSKPRKVQLNWTGSTDNVGVTQYLITRTGTSAASFTTTSTSYLDAAVVVGGTYTYSVKARDAAGNVSGSSNTATITVTKN